MVRSRSLLFAIVLFFLTACSGPTTSPQVTGLPPTMDVFGSPYPTWTPGPLPALTPTLAAREPDNLTTAELHERLDPFSSEACALPCYGGLIAGQSNTQDVIDFYSRLGVGIQDLIPGDYPKVEDRTGRMGAYLSKTSDILEAMEGGFEPPLVDIYIENDVVQHVYVGWTRYYPPYLTLPRVLEMMGQPDQLTLGLVFGRAPVTFVVQVVYMDERVGFSYYGNTLGDAAVRQVCLSDEQVALTYLGLFAPDLMPMEGRADGEYLLPLEETLAISYADFAARMSGGGCLDIFSGQWGPWQAIQANVDATRTAIQATQTQEAENE